METSTALYARLLAEPGRSLGSLRDELDCGEQEFEQALDELRGLGLLRSATAAGGPAGGVAAVSIDTAVRRLLADSDRRFAELLGEARRTHERVERLHARYLPLRTGSAHELVRGADRVTALLEDAARGARTEALSLRPGQDQSESGLAEKLARERIALAHRVALRTIYPAAALHQGPVLAHVQALTAAGALIRVAHTLPLWLIVVDAGLAVLPAPGEPPGSAAVVVRDPAVVGVVRELFEHFWASSWVPPELLGRTTPDDRHREVLRLLAAGLTDQAIGRKLEISDRTVRRLVADLTAALGAQSRFQAGVHATRLGWI
ncbi:MULTISPECIES: helix-turn-helix transcriptional regulator [Kitasatospora]|uniref:Putative LuxR family transcriptional regulator n=1 Tax=Kitasatospora setae (strain ATCC 33774 / DSM 43861 / JCM 3304 / KCC A-0304 / NBRC 14216 / KM-6054) TaxID=452652 RepID=E4NBQ1_KITSK|nr:MULTISPECIES: helix-turn-helix transcriptional regulator [Kitasatospora]BAJ28632.1 putative LuxR family transcriptional regulator [Kitasatospora setae KM-6054]